MKLNKITIIFLVILIVAFLIRLSAVNYGLPLRLFGDEYIHLANALKMLEQKTLFLSFSYLPPLVSYLLMPLIVIYGLVGLAVGQFVNLADFREAILLNSEQLLIFTRIISATFGALTVWCLFKFGSKLFSPLVGLAASCLLAFDFLHLTSSLTGWFWVTLGFFILFAISCLWQLAKTGQAKYYWWSAVFIGLGFGTGLLSLLLLPWLFLAHAFYKKPKNFRQFFDKKIAVSLAIVILIIIFFALGNMHAVLRQFGRVIAIVLSNFGVEFSFSAIENVRRQADILGNVKIIFGALAADLKFILPFIFLGIYFVFKDKLLNWFEKSLLVGFPVLYLLSLMFFFAKAFPRFNVPLIPFFLIFGAYGLIRLIDHFKLVRKSLVVFSLTVLLFLPSLMTEARLLPKFFLPDTRLKALDWLKENVPAGSRLIIDEPDLILGLTKDKASIELLKANSPFWVNTKEEYLLTLPAEQYPESAYFIYDWRHLDLDKLIPGEIVAEYYLVSFWQRDYLKIPEKNKRFQALADWQKELVAKFYPSESLEVVNDLPNSSREVELTLKHISRFGPFVEIYKLNQ